MKRNQLNNYVTTETIISGYSKTLYWHDLQRGVTSVTTVTTTFLYAYRNCWDLRPEHLAA